ncbi:transcriptional regulator [Flavobacterium sp. SOK18b]|uniref:RrF2 family transcriptional regulator n=1 Tax=Flavobacterium sp. SOK18b TaxID=797900 RepID=UPI0015F85134|nr:Rrf2 family transcriptional regulator [Flavobacterium sp. SOK18b]MBB1192355.1 transcriptional regulator [Flavobacterium sp. SOK18b]
MISGKFAITIHILTLLHQFPEEYLSSEFLASSMNVHPVLVRKEIANLKKNNIVVSKEGKNGGSKLSVSAASLTLDTIFKMTFETVNLGYAKNTPNPKCPIGRKMNEKLTDLYDEINTKISSELSNITLEKFSNQF